MSQAIYSKVKLMAIILTSVALSMNISFANSDGSLDIKLSDAVDNQEQDLFKFEPSNLAIYIPKDTVIDKTVYDLEGSKSTSYNVNYKGIEFYIEINQRPYFFPQATETSLKLANINQIADFHQKKCTDENKICTTVAFRGGGVVAHAYTSISYSTNDYPNNIGDEFLNGLFIDNTNLTSSTPSTLTVYGPNEINIIYFGSASNKIPDEYYDHDKYENFARFTQYINQNSDKYKYRIIIQGHTDKIESEAGLGDSLSQSRAESVKQFLINEYDLKPTTRIEFQIFQDKRPIALNDSESGRSVNRRVRVYIDRTYSPGRYDTAF